MATTPLFLTISPYMSIFITVEALLDIQARVVWLTIEDLSLPDQSVVN
jgi:hypothetical protein